MEAAATGAGKAGEALLGKAGVRTSPRKESRKFFEVMASMENPPAPATAGKTQSPAPMRGADPGQPIEYTVKPGDSLWKIGRKLFNRDPYQIARDNGLADPNLIRPGQKLVINPAPAPAEPARVSGEVMASWYGAEHHNKVTASGQRFDMNQNTLAHRTLPLGTKVRLVNPDNGRSAEGVVTDRGPFIKGRDVDVSYAMAKKLGFVRKGIAKLDIETI
jgi:rare lipoprotein A